MAPRTQSRIAIIGGGPGGLTFARILQTRGIAVTVFEQERSRAARSQGGSLDLHPRSGLYALELAGLTHEFRALARYEDQRTLVVDKAGTMLAEEHDDERPEIDRTDLRAMLLDSLDPQVIRWGAHLDHVRALDDGTYELGFADGQTATFDLVVGADGAWSRVRPLVTEVKPFYTGITIVDTQVSDVDQSHPAIAAMVGHGSFSALDEGKRLVAQRNGHGVIRIYVTLRENEDWATRSGIDFSDPQATRKGLLNLFPDWNSDLLGLIRESDDSFVVRPLYMLPVGHTWQSRAGVTLLGDAAHLMSPFAGQGVNLAMLDAAELAVAITEGNTLAEAVRSYEQTMFVRAERAAAVTAASMEKAMKRDAPQHFEAEPGHVV